MKHSLTIIALGLLIAAGSVTLYGITPAMAEKGHDHAEHDNHDHDDTHKDDGAHEDEHDEDDEHGHGHGEHEEGSTQIHDEAAQAAGIKIRTAKPMKIAESLTLTGRVMLNRNTTAQVRARFAGIVQSVKVNWGDKVSKGQTLATVEANESLRSYAITAPTDGVVLTRNTNIGDVTGDEVLFTVSDLSEVWAEFHVFSRDLGKVKKGQQVRVRTLDDTQSMNANITLILPTADPLSQTVVAVVSIPNKDGAWRPGMTVEGDVLLETKNAKLAVTKQAVQRMEDQTVVFVKEGSGYEMRPVTLGKSDGQHVEVLSGLKAGEQYVSEGSFIVKADIGKAAAKHEH